MCVFLFLFLFLFFFVFFFFSAGLHLLQGKQDSQEKPSSLCQLVWVGKKLKGGFTNSHTFPYKCVAGQQSLQLITQTARLILRERVDFARQQTDRNRQNRAATVDSCFVLIGTRQHGVAVLYETSDRASSNKMQQNPCPIKFRIKFRLCYSLFLAD